MNERRLPFYSSFIVPRSSFLRDSLLVGGAAALDLLDLCLKDFEVEFEEDAALVVELDALVEVFARLGLVAAQELREASARVGERGRVAVRLEREAAVEIGDCVWQVAFY